MKKNNSNSYKSAIILIFISYLMTFSPVYAQFNSRGDASFSSVDPSSNLEPIELLPDNVRPTSGYGIGNVSAVNGKNSHIVIVKGDLASGVNWQQDYVSEHNIQAVKALIHENLVYVLFNVTEKEPYKYSGIFVIDPATGSVIKTKYFARFSPKLYYYDYESKDFTVCDKNLVVLCERTHGGIYDVRGSHIILIEPTNLNVLTSFVPYFKSNECIVPVKVVTHDDHFIVLFLSKDACDNAYYDETVLGRFYYDATNNMVMKTNNVVYTSPNGVSHANLAFNIHDNSLPLLFQETGQLDRAGDLNLYILDPVSLLPNFKNSYPLPGRYFLSNLRIDSKNISLSGANNTFQMGNNGSAKVLFNHSGGFVSMINNPYSIGTSGDDRQRVYTNGIISLFVTHDIGKVNWIFGYGASRSCELTNDFLRNEDKNIDVTEGLDIKEDYMLTDRFLIENKDLRFTYKIECQSGRFGREGQDLTGLSEISKEKNYKIRREENRLDISSKSTITNYKISDSYGKIIKRENLNEKTLSVDMESLSKGIYILSLEINSELFIEKIIH